MMSDRLVILANGRKMGEVRKHNNARLSLVYEAEWQHAVDSYPLSLSMPLVISEYPHAKIEAWLWGLLPDNDGILTRWAQRFKVSPRNAFSLLSYVGEDCAGAIQLVRPERVESLLTDPTGNVEWLDESDIAERLRLLRRDQAAWRVSRDAGQFSLAGAQPKTALYFENGRWGIPSGRMPTTHIIKPPNESFDGHAENEHICLKLARAIGLPAANSEIRKFESETAIVVERFDRVREEGGIYRLHQEDMCQALGVHPSLKYENQSGPGIPKIVGLLRDYSALPADDVWTFIEAVAFNWVIGGTDAHAKNYSVLIGAQGRTRFAPLYDVSSALPYDFDFKKLSMAMKIGTTYALNEISIRDWNKLAASTRLDVEQLYSRIRNLLNHLPDALSDIVATAKAEGLENKVIQKLETAIRIRTTRCQNIFA